MAATEQMKSTIPASGCSSSSRPFATPFQKLAGFCGAGSAFRCAARSWSSSLALHAPPDDATGLQSAVVDFPLRRLKPYLELVGLGLADACLGTVEKRRRAPAPADDAEMPAAKQQKGDLG